MSYVIQSGTIRGIDGIPVQVEIDLLRRLPSITIVGLPGSAVRESADRVRSALQQSGFDFPKKRIVINLAPAGIKKNGAAFDLPIAIGILAAMHKVPPSRLADSVFVGELSLSGTLRPVSGVLSIALMARKYGFKRIFLPQSNASEANLVPSLEVIPLQNLQQFIAYCEGHSIIQDCIVEEPTPKNLPDFAAIKGQGIAKRAMEVSAAGAHNVLMIGSPGCGKTMLALRLPSILPSLTVQESIEVTQIHSVAGTQQQRNLMLNRPFRAPHHSISISGMLGNAQLQPGEASLAHNGVLFLDELPEFRRDVLESLRAPLEDRTIQLVRAGGSVSLPANFSLVAAANPCPCGYDGHREIPCLCTPSQKNRYAVKLSGPLQDRIDLQIWLEPTRPEELFSSTQEESSARIRSRVQEARERQERRYRDTEIRTNAQLDGLLLKQYIRLTSAATSLLKESFRKHTLSSRSWSRLLKVARTIADLEGKPKTHDVHLLEAIAYRTQRRENV